MAGYLLRRLLAMIPTLFGITIACFAIVNLAPGSPVEQRLQAIQMDGGASGGVSQEVIDALKRQYGLDKPLLVRYGIWLKNAFSLDFGQSFTFEEPVLRVIASRLPVSLSFGVLSLFLACLASVPLGVLKAIWPGGAFDAFTSALLFAALSIAPIMLAVLCIVFFAGGSYLELFPIGGMTSDAHDSLGLWGRFLDRAHHFVLPLLCFTIGQFAFLTILMKNSMLEALGLECVRTARAKGLPERAIHLKHALRNALIPMVTAMGGHLNAFFAGSLILEQAFRLDGIGRLSLQAISSRDCNLLMGLIFLESVFFLLGRALIDVLYVAVDPRIDFAAEAK